MKTVDQMTAHEIGRWCALIEGVNLIADKCDERGMNFENLKITPNALEKYVEKTCDFFTIKVTEQDTDQAIKKSNKPSLSVQIHSQQDILVNT